MHVDDKKGAVRALRELGARLTRDDRGAVIEANLWGTVATDEDLKLLEHLPELRYVYVGFTRVTSRGVERLRRELPETTVYSR